MKLKIGAWVVYDCDELWRNVFDAEESVLFETKREALAAVSSANLDPSKHRKVKRVEDGKYHYYPKSCDTGEYGEYFVIERVTSRNQERLTKLLDEE